MDEVVWLGTVFSAKAFRASLQFFDYISSPRRTVFFPAHPWDYFYSHPQVEIMITLQKMKPEDKLLFVLARQEFLHTHQKTVLDICSAEEIRWDIVYSTAKLHGVAPLIYSNLRQCNSVELGIPQDIMEQFKLYSYRNVVMEKCKTEKLMEVLSLLNRKCIDVMFIKGVALDVLVYDHPWFTIKNDVDLLLRPKREEVADRDRIEIWNFIKGRGFECDYFGHHDITSDGFLPINFQKIWNEAVKIKFKG